MQKAVKELLRINFNVGIEILAAVKLLIKKSAALISTLSQLSSAIHLSSSPGTTKK
jgi:hypothetical protein